MSTGIFVTGIRLQETLKTLLLQLVQMYKGITRPVDNNTEDVHNRTFIEDKLSSRNGNAEEKKNAAAFCCARVTAASLSY